MVFPTIPLLDISKITMGQSPPGDSYNTKKEGIPLFQGKAEFGEVYPVASKWCTKPTRIAKKGDILLSVRAPVGPTNIANQDCCIGRGLSAIRAKQDLASQKYLYYHFKFIEPFLSSRGQGSTFSAINKAEVEKILVPLPLIAEQRRIVEILDQADSLRKKRAEANAKAERILLALFIKMFGNPTENSMGWDVKSLADINTGFRYGTSTRCSSDSDAGGLPVLRIPNILGDEIDTSNLKYGTFSQSETEKLTLQHGDLLFVRTNGNPDYVGRCAVFDLKDNYLYASYLIRARFDADKADPWYIAACLRTPQGRNIMAPYIRTTAGQSNISAEGLRQLAIPLPPIEDQRNFKERMSDFYRLRKQTIGSSESLETLFQNLLYRAFSGDLTAEWRKAHMAELLQEMEHQAKALGLEHAVEYEQLGMLE